MNLKRAIEIKLQWRKDNYPPALADEMNADMLSIEALKVLSHGRLIGAHHDPALLPGETKE